MIMINKIINGLKSNGKICREATNGKSYSILNNASLDLTTSLLGITVIILINIIR
jgi:hypothetical protein